MFQIALALRPHVRYNRERVGDFFASRVNGYRDKLHIHKGRVFDLFNEQDVADLRTLLPKLATDAFVQQESGLYPVFVDANVPARPGPLAIEPFDLKTASKPTTLDQACALLPHLIGPTDATNFIEHVAARLAEAQQPPAPAEPVVPATPEPTPEPVPEITEAAPAAAANAPESEPAPEPVSAADESTELPADAVIGELPPALPPADQEPEPEPAGFTPEPAPAKKKHKKK
jgi:hypothetical protein